MKTKHTPGPWRHVRVQGGSFYIQSKNVRHPNNHGGWHDVAVASLQHIEEDEEANARLIAAAPELLDALEDAVAYPVTGTWASKAYAAIAKAKGEDQ